MEGLGSIASDSIQWLFMVAMSQWWLLLLVLGAALLVGLHCWRFRMERQKNFPARIDVTSLLNEDVKALLDDTRDLSSEDATKIKKKLEQRLGELREDLEDEDVTVKPGELEDEIREIEAVLAQFDEIMWWTKIHVSDLNTVIDVERPRINERRKQAAREFQAALLAERAREDTGQEREEAGRLTAAERKYGDLLAKREQERAPIGLAFSSGGIRSGTFNLGLAQGLARYGFLPWVDYLTSVSGGGLAASCMTTLLLMKGEKTEEGDGKGKKKKRKYRPFNTQWSRFPFNPELRAFDVQGAAQGAEPDQEVGPSVEKGHNKQLEYLRNNGNYIIPRMGWVTRDVMRGVGAFLATIAYTLSVFLLVLVALAAVHYGLTAALTPAITRNLDLSAIGKVEEPGPEPGQLTVNLRLEDEELVVDLPLATPAQEEDVTEDAETEAGRVDLLHLIIGDYKEGGEAVPLGEEYAIQLPPELGWTLGAGFLFSFLIGLVLHVLYRKDPTTRYRLRPWKSPLDEVTVGAYLTIFRIRVVGLISLVVLSVLTLWLWIGHYGLWSQSATDSRDFYRAWGLFFVPLACAAGWFVFRHCRDHEWTKRGLPEQLRIDNLVKYLVAGLFVWSLALWISFLRLRNLGLPDPRIFWIWLPAVFTVGAMIGLAVFRIIPWTHRVYFEPGRRYTTDAIGWLSKMYFRMLEVKADPDYVPVPSGGMDYKLSVWSNLEFRSMFWTLQGLALYGLAVSLMSALLALPHYFSLGMDGDADAVVPLGAAIITAGWAAFLSSVNRMEASRPKNLLVRIIALPEGVRRYVLGILVIALNLTIIFLVQSAMDDVSVVGAFEVGVVAAVFLCLIGKCLDFNYLTPHYFARDRIAEVFMKTEVETRTGQVKPARDHRAKRLSDTAPSGCSAPYHLVLTALNLPGSWHLTHKDRKSVPFIFSKYFCGSDITGYARTRRYRGGITKYARAIALSGAAVSPGLGYHTFFAQAFMTTLLNVRLGLWMSSPQQYILDVLAKYAQPHQTEKRVFWPFYLGDEAMGRMSERRPLVNLTDGEHTGDGIGLYPLFQRRCKIIIAGDSSGDPAGLACGLYCVIRQVKADLGIEVDINVDGTRPAVYDTEQKLAEPSRRHFAVGRITYPALFDDQGSEISAGFKGWLIYFKTAVTKHDPGAILSYWETHKMDFPSPTTADQFFDEEQWEFQRWLGEYTVEYTLEELGRYCDERLQARKKLAEQGDGGRADKEKQKKIERLEAQKRLAEHCLEHNAIDYDLLKDNPDLFEWVLGTLYEITNTPEEGS